MKAPLVSAVTAALAIASCPLALAEDVRFVFSGVVTSVNSGGVATAPFAGAQVGEIVTLTVDVELTSQHPFGNFAYPLNAPTSSLSIGTSTDGFATPSLQQLFLEDNAVEYGDYVFFSSRLAGDPSTIMQVFLSDAFGQTWTTDDLPSLYGTTVQAASLTSVFQIYSQTGSVNFDLQTVQIDPAPGGLLGTPYCAAEPNSTGQPGETFAFGLDTPADNDLSLIASGLPLNVFGYFIASQTQGFAPGAGGSSGNLCLGGAIGRFVGPGQIKNADIGGEIALAIDLTTLPTPNGPAAVQAGETWNVQLWHRDTSVAGSTSNFTRGLAITFQ